MKSDPIADAAAAARRGDVIVMPTDTVYGIGTAPGVEGATATLFDAKVRDHDRALPVLVGSLQEAERIAVVDERAARLAASCWPGALTLVLERGPSSRGWDLGGDPTTVGVRVPRHRLAAAVLARSGPLAVTSANRSGSAPLETCDELHETFGDLVAVYLCDEAPLVGDASTVVDLAHGRARLLRRGRIPLERIEGSLEEGPLLDSRPSS